MTNRYAAPIALALLAAACSRELDSPAGNGMTTTPAARPTVVPTIAPTPPARDYLGRWTGVEGMILNVAAGSKPDTFTLDMQYDLDHHGRFDATLGGDTLTFQRDGKRETLTPTDGNETGLKYLAGKKDCLTVKPGEGYCRN